MAVQLFTNNGYGVLASGITNVATSISLVSGGGARFPSPSGGDWFQATLIGLAGDGTENAWEIVQVTARSTDTLTVVRGQEGTSAVAWGGATRIELRPTADTLRKLAHLDTAQTWTATQTFSNVAGSGYTTGSVPFIGASGVISQDNANFFYDGTNHRLALLNAAPTATLSVGASEQFKVTSAGVITGVGTNITGLDAGNISAGTLALARGGTNTGTAMTAGSVHYAGTSGAFSQDNANFFYDGTNHRLALLNAAPTATLSVGASEQFKVTSAGVITGVGTNITGLDAGNISAGTLALARGGTNTGTAMTAGSVHYAGASGAFSQDNANFFYDGTNHRLALLNAAPTATLSVGASEQFKVTSAGVITGVGTNITGLDAGNVSAGTLAVARGGTGTGTALTQGSIVFAGASGVYSQNNAALSWDDTNKQLTLTNTTASKYPFTIKGPGVGTAQANMVLTSPGVAQGEQSNLSLWATFVGTGDNGPRRTADIIAGFSAGSWGYEFLALCAGHAGASNEGAIVTSEQMRLENGGITALNFMSFGSGSPNVKMKRLYVTLNNTQGASSTVAHGLSDIVKIVGIWPVVHCSLGAIPPHYTLDANYEYNGYADATNMIINTKSGNSGGIVGNGCVITIMYEK